MTQPVLLVHGGAWDIIPAWRERSAAGCLAAARAGYAVLRAGGSAVDGVAAAVRALEDDPIFNAGRGAARDAEGNYSLDASIMRGDTLAAGGVAALPPTRHPVDLARAVMEHSPHVLLAGPRALEWGAAHGVFPCAPGDLAPPPEFDRPAHIGPVAKKPGDTVGAVALDAASHLAAATSTGGTWGKHPARVGDSPLIGCGTYADDAAGAASATGHGESIIRVTLTRACVDALRAGEAPEAAARRLVTGMAARTGGTGGVILLNREGGPGFFHSTSGMSWGLCGAGEERSGWKATPLR